MGPFGNKWSFLVDAEREDAAGGVHFAHLHGMVFLLVGGADEPAAAHDGLKHVPVHSSLFVVEEETVHVPVRGDAL